MQIKGKQIKDGSINLTSKMMSGTDIVVDFGGSKLTNLKYPETDTDAATKAYVDALGSSSSYCNSVAHVLSTPITSAPSSYRGSRVLSTNGSTPGIYEYNSTSGTWKVSDDWSNVSSSAPNATLIPCAETGTVFVASIESSSSATFTELPQEVAKYSFGTGLNAETSDGIVYVNADTSVLATVSQISALNTLISQKQDALTSSNAGDAIDITDGVISFAHSGDGYYIDSSNRYTLQYVSNANGGILSAAQYSALMQTAKGSQGDWMENDTDAASYVNSRTHYLIPQELSSDATTVGGNATADITLAYESYVGDRIKLSTDTYGYIYAYVLTDYSLTFNQYVIGELSEDGLTLTIENNYIDDLNIYSVTNMTQYSAVKKLDALFLPEIEILETEPSSTDSYKAYALYIDGEQAGESIEIPKDKLIEKAETCVVSEEDVEEGGKFGPGTQYYGQFEVGDSYIDFTIYVGGSPSTEHIYVNISSMNISSYKGSDSIEIGEEDEDGKKPISVAVDEPLVSPEITVEWSTGSSEKSIVVERGSSVDFTASWSWTSADGHKDPESAASSLFGDDLPDSGEQSEEETVTGITSNSSYSIEIYASKKGLEVSGSKVILATGNDSESDTISVKFGDYRYFGFSGTIPTSSEEILHLDQVDEEPVTNGSDLNLEGVSPDSDEYTIYAYPSSHGELEAIIQDLALPVLDAFTQSTVTVTNASGANVEYYVYCSNNKGAFSNAKLSFEL